MVKCPVCQKEISELDEKCPYCHIIFDDMISENIQEERIIQEIQTEENAEYKSRNNANYLNIMAYINIVLSIVGAISIWVCFSTVEVTKKYTYSSGTYTDQVINWYGIFGGLGILIVGFTLFFLLKTLCDIYWKVER